MTKLLIPPALLALAAFLAIGFYQGTLHLTWHLLPLLILYPVWGIGQQFLLIALTAGNLRDLAGTRISWIYLVLLPAILFAAVHYPSPPLMAATFVLAIIYGLVYLTERNLWVLGIFHGWLAVFYYYTVVGRDPFVDTFGNLLR